MKILKTLTIILVLFMTACSSTRYEGPSQSRLARSEVKILLFPFDNVTDSESASPALTQMTASALHADGVNYTIAESNLPPIKNKESGERRTWIEIAREGGYTHLLKGTVHEYRYKTDLDGDPAVGVSMKLINTVDEKTDWQASSTTTGYAYASVNSASQLAANRLVAYMFKDSHRALLK